MTFDRDVVVQKVLTGFANDEEKEWLLNNLMVFYNEVLILLSKRDFVLRSGGGGV